MKAMLVPIGFVMGISGACLMSYIAGEQLNKAVICLCLLWFGGIMYGQITNK
jgi:hypothetical protein